MNRKTVKKSVLIISVVMTAAILALSLTACLKIGMTENNIEKKLREAGASVSNERTTPMTVEGQSSHRIGDILLAKLAITEGEEATEADLYVFFAMDSRSADWVVDKCHEYVDANAEVCAKWNVYKYDNVVMCGHYKLLSIARGY